MRSIASAVLVAAIAAPAHAVNGGGTTWFNGAPTEVSIGSTFTFCIEGPANSPALFMASGGQGPVHSKKYGDILLDFPLMFELLVTLDSNGSFCFDVEVECDPAIVGVTVYSQFITCTPHIGISNQVATTIVDQASSEDDDSDSDSSADSDNDSDEDSNADSDKDSDEDSNADSDKDSNKDSNADSDKDSDEDSNADSDKDSNKDSDKDSNKDSDKD